MGDLSAPVRRIEFAADPTMEVVRQAIERGTDLLVCHHPLLFRSVHEVSGLGVHGDIVRRLSQAGCALWVGHTNADAAYRGTGMAAADLFGLVDQRPLVPIDDPTAVHPVGLGRVGSLPEPMTLEAFARRVADVLPHTELGVQVCGPLDATVRTVAVLPGSGDSLFDEGARRRRRRVRDQRPAASPGHGRHRTGALRGRDARPRHRTGQRGCGHPAAADQHAHSAIESLWFHYALEDVPQAVEQATWERPQVYWNRMNTDPWTLSIR